MGMDDHLTSARKQEAIKQLRAKLGDSLKPHHDDLKLTKFLIARKYNVNAAAEMLRKHLKYAKTISLDTLLTDFTPSKKTDFFPTIPLGFDFRGSYVRLMTIGVADVKGLAMSFRHVEAARTAAYVLESDKKLQRTRYLETGEGGEDMQSYIVDLKDLQIVALLNKQVIQLAIFLLRMYEANYPESLKKAYVVNVPTFFGLIFNLLKSLLPAEILQKIEVATTPGRLRELIKGKMHSAIVPASLGGTLVGPDGDPNCYSLFPVPPGSPVPKDFYYSNNLQEDPEASVTLVLNRSSFKVTQQVDVPGSFITWRFQTSENDIGMSVYFKKNDNSKPTCVLPMTRVSCQRYIEVGFMECEEPGIYEVIFDNTYSWWAKKKLVYKVRVFKPGELVTDD